MKTKTIGELLIEARKKKKISQDELAKYMHVTRQTVSNWENNKNIPDITIIVDLCKYLNIDLNTLVSSNNNDIINTTNLIKVENKKIKRKFLIPIIIIITIILICIGLFLLILQRNYFEVYDCNLIGENFSLNYCSLVKSKVKNYFQFGTLSSDLKYDDLIISLYYKTDDNARKLILEQGYENDIKIIENYGYDEYFYGDLDDVYLDLTYTYNNKRITQTFKMQFNLQFKDNKLFYTKYDHIYDSTTPKDNPTKELANSLLSRIDEESLSKHNYKYDYQNNAYMKKDKNISFLFDNKMKELIYSKKEENQVITIIYYFDYNAIDVTIFFSDLQKNNVNLFYDLNNDQKCNINSCNYEYGNIILNELKKIANVK